MPMIDVVGLPGIRAVRTAKYGRILLQGEYTFLAQGRIINGNSASDPGNSPDVAVLRAGLLMGKITSSSLYANSILGTLTSGGTVGSTSLTFSAATATELNRRVGGSGTFKLTGPNVASGLVGTETVTYSAVNTTTGVVTCTAIVNAYIAGSFMQPTDGSEFPRTFVPDGWSIYVQDLDGNRVASVEFPQIPIAGVIDATQLINWPSDASLQLWLMDRLNDAPGGQFVFNQIY